MGFRRMQKAQNKKRAKSKDVFREDQLRERKKPNKNFKKYKKFKWSDDDYVTEA